MTKIILSASVALFICAACAIRSADQVVERNKIPPVAAGVPANQSEIREIAFNKVVGESGHKDLHLRGMLFTKKESGGSSQIVPCSGCVVMMKGVQDTSVTIRMTTESDGYFTFHGKPGVFNLSLNNPGHNSVVIAPVDFEPGGVNSLVLVNALGNLTERFRITHHDRKYTWTRD